MRYHYCIVVCLDLLLLSVDFMIVMGGNGRQACMSRLSDWPATTPTGESALINKPLFVGEFLQSHGELHAFITCFSEA